MDSRQKFSFNPNANEFVPSYHNTSDLEQMMSGLNAGSPTSSNSPSRGSPTTVDTSKHNAGIEATPQYPPQQQLPHQQQRYSPHQQQPPPQQQQQRYSPQPQYAQQQQQQYHHQQFNHANAQQARANAEMELAALQVKVAQSTDTEEQRSIEERIVRLRAYLRPMLV